MQKKSFIISRDNAADIFRQVEADIAGLPTWGVVKVEEDYDPGVSYDRQVHRTLHSTYFEEKVAVDTVVQLNKTQGYSNREYAAGGDEPGSRSLTFTAEELIY